MQMYFNLLDELFEGHEVFEDLIMEPLAQVNS